MALSKKLKDKIKEETQRSLWHRAWKEVKNLVKRYPDEIEDAWTQEIESVVDLVHVRNSLFPHAF